MFLELASTAWTLASAGLIAAVAVGVADLALSGHSDWAEDREEL
ncbi:hypothetical protein [Antrihabitans stalagmiti]|nr:hypothetical protein [Antrihabitans stalagmiti]